MDSEIKHSHVERASFLPQPKQLHFLSLIYWTPKWFPFEKKGYLVKKREREFEKS